MGKRRVQEMTDAFPAVVRKSGGSKVITIPAQIASEYKELETVNVTISKRKGQDSR